MKSQTLHFVSFQQQLHLSINTSNLLFKGKQTLEQSLQLNRLDWFSAKRKIYSNSDIRESQPNDPALPFLVETKEHEELEFIVASAIRRSSSNR